MYHSIGRWNCAACLSLLGIAAVPASATSTLTTLSATTDITGQTNSGSITDYAQSDANTDTSGFSSSLFDQAILSNGMGDAESQAVQDLVMHYDGGNGDFLGLNFDGDAYAYTVLIPPAGGTAYGESNGESHLYVVFTVTEETPWSISDGVAVDDTGLMTRPGVNVRLREFEGPSIYNYFPPLPPTSGSDSFSGSGVLPPGDYELIAYVAAETSLFTDVGESGSKTSEGSLQFVFALPEPGAGWLMVVVLPLLVRRLRR